LLLLQLLLLKVLIVLLHDAWVLLSLQYTGKLMPRD